MFYEDTKIWNQNTITFYFLDGTSQQKSEVKEFAKLWERYSGITFKYSTEKPPFFSFKKYYTITFKGKSNESTRGAINGKIRFGALSENKIFRKTTVLHEFGHMLGLGHEHQRLDRPEYLNDSNLVFSCKENQNQSRQWCKENFSNKNKVEVFIESEFDPLSIMHYRLDHITGITNTKIKDNSLSYTDKYFIAMLYNQNIADSTLKKMHKQDLWHQQKFESKVNRERENEIMKLSSYSCQPLQYPTKSKDGRYCEKGFMVIDTNGFSFAGDEFKKCHSSLKEVSKLIKTHPLCQLNSLELKRYRQKLRNDFAEYGNCKRLDSNIKNNQEFFCSQGYSYVTKLNNLIGEKTQCYPNEESTYQAMQNDSVCSMDKLEFSRYQNQQKTIQEKRLKTPYCQVVNKKYKSISCPTDFDYTIINLDIKSKPINNKCFASKHQAINAMGQIPFCQKL